MTFTVKTLNNKIYWNKGYLHLMLTILGIFIILLVSVIQCDSELYDEGTEADELYPSQEHSLTKPFNGT